MSELEEYQQQLHDIYETLANDPHNETLLALKEELVDLIALLKKDGGNKQEEPSKAASPVLRIDSPEPSTLQFKVGDMMWVKTKLEKQFRQARVVTISGNFKMATVAFTDSNVSETYPVGELYKEKPKDQTKIYKQQQQKATKPKDEKYEQQLNQGAQSWQSFTKKNKKVKKDKSLFGTSDAVGSKVGVIGSGKPAATVLKKKAQHRFSPY